MEYKEQKAAVTMAHQTSVKSDFFKHIFINDLIH